MDVTGISPPFPFDLCKLHIYRRLMLATCYIQADGQFVVRTEAMSMKCATCDPTSVHIKKTLASPFFFLRWADFLVSRLLRTGVKCPLTHSQGFYHHNVLCYYYSFINDVLLIAAMVIMVNCAGSPEAIGRVHCCGTKGTFKWKCCSQVGSLMFSLCFLHIV